MKAIFLAIMDHHVSQILVLLLIIGIRLLMGKFPARIRVYLWLIPLIAMLCPIRFKSNLGLIEISNNSVSYPLSQLESINQESAIIAGQAKSAVDWIEIFAWVWISVVGLMFLISIVQWINLHIQTRDKVAVETGIYVSDSAESAFVTGIFSSKIILPSYLNDKEKQYIILHEMSHIRMKDHLIHLTGWLCVCLYWFNPLVWMVYRILVLDMEMACDERVLIKLDENERLDYSQCLLNQSGKIKKMVLVTGFRSSDLKKRIQNAISFKKSRIAINLIAVAMVVLSGILLISRPSEIERNTERLKLEMLNQSEEELFLNEVIPFGWDELVVFSPESIFTISELEEILGISDSFQREKGYGFTLMVFMNEQEPVAWLTLHPDLDAFVFSFPHGNEKVLRYTSNELIKLQKVEEFDTIFWRFSGIAYTLDGLDDIEQQLVLMLNEAAREIYEMDSGLNHGIEYLVMDMSELKVLTDQGKSVLMGLLQEHTGIETITKEAAEKKEEVLLSKNVFENGLVITLKSSDETNNEFIFSIGKWRSATGAIFSSDNKAFYENDQWDYEPGRWAIS